MHYYSFNIGDYTSHTAHLSPIEDIAYRRLLDLYYQTELPIPNDIKAVCRLIRMRDHADDVQQVLSEFFTHTDEGWESARCSREIDEYHAKATTARSNGKLGGRPKKQKEPTRNPVGFSGFDNKNPDQTHEKANQEPLTINQEPRTTHTEARASGVARDDLPEPHELPVQTASTSHALSGVVCKAIKQTGIGLVNPGHPKLNALLHAGVTVEQVVAACAKALEKQKNFSYALGILEKEEKEARDLAKELAKPKASARNQPAAKSFAQQEREAGWARWEEMTGRKHPEMEKIRAAESGFAGDVIDITPRGDGLLLEG